MRLVRCLLLVCFSFAAGLAQIAGAQESEARIVTYIEVEPAAAELAAGLLQSLAESSSDARGSEQIEVARRIGRRNHFVLVEVWDSMDSRTDFAESAAARQVHAALEPLLISPLDVRDHNDLSSQDSSSIGPGTVLVVTHVDVFPPFADTLVELMNALIPASRAEDDNVQFDVWVISERANHMTVIEAWEDSAARNRHALSAHTQEFRASLVSMIGALYDERLYRVY